MNGSSEPPAEPVEFPRNGRLLGLDFGTKRVGIAISDDRQQIASPLELLARRGKADDAARLSAIVAEQRAVGLVVGLPLHMGGEEGEKAGQARKFGEWIAAAVNLPVQFWDERLSTVDATEKLLAAGIRRKNLKSRVDKVAAQVLLQSYLDAHRDRRPV